MAARAPWFKFFAADYLLDDKVDALPREAEALVVRMWAICHIEGSCPCEPAAIARKTRCDLAYVERYKGYCLPFFDSLKTERGVRLFSHRMEQEKKRSRVASQNGGYRNFPQNAQGGELFAQQTAEQTAEQVAQQNVVQVAEKLAQPSSDSDSVSDNASYYDSKKEKEESVSVTFRLPTINEVADYCRQRGNSVNPQKWFDYYQSNGWKVGRNPMKDWRAAVRTWEHNDRGGNNGNGTGRITPFEQAQQRIQELREESERDCGGVGDGVRRREQASTREQGSEDNRARLSRAVH